VFPFLRTKWPALERFVRPAAEENTGAVAPAELALLSKTAAADFSKAVDVALEESKTGTSRELAHKRLAAILTAAAFIAEQMSVLSNAHIEDDAEFPELTSAIEKLTTEQVTEQCGKPHIDGGIWIVARPQRVQTWSLTDRTKPLPIGIITRYNSAGSARIPALVRLTSAQAIGLATAGGKVIAARDLYSFPHSMK
jgi:hypothetical protein